MKLHRVPPTKALPARIRVTYPPLALMYLGDMSLEVIFMFKFLTALLTHKRALRRMESGHMRPQVWPRAKAHTTASFGAYIWPLFQVHGSDVNRKRGTAAEGRCAPGNRTGKWLFFAVNRCDMTVEGGAIGEHSGAAGPGACDRIATIKALEARGGDQW